MLAQFQKNHPDDVRLVYRNFPLSYHDKTLIAATAAEAAGYQDKFFEMEAAINAAPDEWGDLSTDDFKTYLTGKAENLGLDMTKFNEDWNSDAAMAAVEEDYNGGVAAGVNSTPSVYINGSEYTGQRSEETLDAILQLMYLKDKQYDECPSTVIDLSKTYKATIKTNKGDIVIELYDDVAPIAVNSFVFLAREGWYDNVIFHRVISGFVAQTGDPLGLGYGGPGYTFINEINPDYTFDAAGVVGMANSGGEDSNGSQFFITYDALPDLDGKYTIFGKVIEGMDVVESLTLRDPSSTETLPEADKIISIEITEE